MSKTLRVIEPFFNLEFGDILELTADGKDYAIERGAEHNEMSANGGDFRSAYSSKFSISVDYAKQLIEENVLEEVKEQETTFVNVFSEIDNLLNKYSTELENLNKDMANMPECLKVEKSTVLQNLVKVLSHLKSLKK